MIFSAIVVYLKAGRITRSQAAAFEVRIPSSQSRNKFTAGPESDPGQGLPSHSDRNPTFKAGRNEEVVRWNLARTSTRISPV
jgi:hypothetical protein